MLCLATSALNKLIMTYYGPNLISFLKMGQGIVAHVPKAFPGLLIRHELRFLMQHLVLEPQR